MKVMLMTDYIFYIDLVLLVSTFLFFKAIIWFLFIPQLLIYYAVTHLSCSKYVYAHEYLFSIESVSFPYNLALYTWPRFDEFLKTFKIKMENNEPSLSVTLNMY